MITDLDVLNKIGSDIIGSAFDIRNAYGRLMLESFYEAVMEIELAEKGHKVERQVNLSICHKGVVVPKSYVADMIVDGSIVVEFKALPSMNGEEFRQLMTYMKITGMKLGYLINFGASDFRFGRFEAKRRSLIDGMYRVIN